MWHSLSILFISLASHIYVDKRPWIHIKDTSCSNKHTVISFIYKLGPPLLTCQAWPPKRYAGVTIHAKECRTTSAKNPNRGTTEHSGK